MELNELSDPGYRGASSSRWRQGRRHSTPLTRVRWCICARLESRVTEVPTWCVISARGVYFPPWCLRSPRGVYPRAVCTVLNVGEREGLKKKETDTIQGGDGLRALRLFLGFDSDGPCAMAGVVLLLLVLHVALEAGDRPLEV